MAVDADFDAPGSVTAHLDENRPEVLVIDIEIVMVDVHGLIPLVIKAHESLLLSLAAGEGLRLTSWATSMKYDLVSDGSRCRVLIGDESLRCFRSELPTGIS
jgi:hypothetical protein